MSTQEGPILGYESKTAPAPVARRPTHPAVAVGGIMAYGLLSFIFVFGVVVACANGKFGDGFLICAALACFTCWRLVAASIALYEHFKRAGLR